MRGKKKEKRERERERENVQRDREDVWGKPDMEERVKKKRDTATSEHVDFYKYLTKRKSIKEKSALCVPSPTYTVINYETVATVGEVVRASIGGLKGKETVGGYKRL